jgi:hypothetical protein
MDKVTSRHLVRLSASNIMDGKAEDEPRLLSSPQNVFHLEKALNDYGTASSGLCRCAQLMELTNATPHDIQKRRGDGACHRDLDAPGANFLLPSSFLELSLPQSDTTHILPFYSGELSGTSAPAECCSRHGQRHRHQSQPRCQQLHPAHRHGVATHRLWSH